jgi:hypothetical protein
MRFALVLSLGILMGCAGRDGSVPSPSKYEPFVGTYRGSFASALTEDPADDLNYSACNPAEADCNVHEDPLIDILLQLSVADNGGLAVAFFRSPSDLAAGKQLDLLGRGCITRLGTVGSLNTRLEPDGLLWTALFPLTVENRLCLGKLRPTSDHALELAYHIGPADGDPYIEVLIDRAVVSENYMYVKENGVEKRVRLNLAGKVGEGSQARYQACIENDLGEFDRCVLTDKKLKQVFLPVPLPGGAAANYTWWHDLDPNLKRTRGLYSLEQYTGRFDRENG